MPNRFIGLLADGLQGASNAAASNVSAPVDGLAWLLRKAGVPVGDAPIGGSDWMAQKGLTRQPTNQIAGLLGESLGGVAPIMAAAKAPQIARGLLQAGENMAARPTLNPQAGAIVWHGSPHKFDAFDSSKIGTGEGAQAYGHGIYTPEAQSTGQYYKDTLRGLRTDTKEVVSDLMPERHFTTKERAEIFKAAMEEGKPVEVAARQLGYRQASIRDVPPEVLRQAVERVREQGQGYLYKVDLPDEHIAKMLDWDKPLTKQSKEAKKLLRNDSPGLFDVGNYSDKLTAASDIQSRYVGPVANLYRELQGVQGVQRYGRPADDMRGTDFWYTAMRRANGDPAKAAQMLRNAGIPGIRYLDGGSRGAGSGTSNFVVFPGNEGLLSILERNGKPIK